LLPVIQIGPAAIQLPGLLLLFGVWLASSQIVRSALLRGLRGPAVNACLAFGLLTGVLGARLAYVVSHVTAYAPRPLDLFALSPASLDPAAGGMLGVMAFAVVAHRRRIPLLPLLDSLGPGLALFSVFGGLSRLASGNDYGIPTQIPWAVTLLGTERHPVQLYEALAALGLFGFLRTRTDPIAGRTFALWVVGASASDLIIEAFRHPVHLGPAGVRLPQVVATTALLVGLGLYGYMTQRDPTPPPPPPNLNASKRSTL
jgi:phosphatidylglycerol:prolipoprotein diacylglycerol transferase